ncbi:hypothetical protein [Streptomyces sp. B21-083]|uniref:hypothetical protein n=1 Tax=Streptomyces sp. B21-083 TaxID=3039410 RepID=UPI002FF2AA5F
MQRVFAVLEIPQSALAEMPWWAAFFLIFVLGFARVVLPKESHDLYMWWIAFWEHRRKHAALKRRRWERRRAVRKKRKQDQEQAPPSL